MATPAAGVAQFAYMSNNGAITITGDTDIPVNGGVTIPNTILVGGVSLPVTSIGDYAFQWSTTLTSVTIGTNVTSIGNYSFDNRTNLISLTIPNSVTTIGAGAFTYCPRLTNFAIPDSVTSIGDYAFNSCSGLTSVTLPSGVASIVYLEFDGCSSLTNVSIPDSVTSFGSHAFDSCINLASVTIGGSVTNIGDDSFLYCYSLKNVTIPDGVTSIGYMAFAECTNLTSVTIPSSVVGFGSNVLILCTGLANVYFEGNPPGVVSSDYGSSVFVQDFRATAYYLPGTTGWGTIYDYIPTALWKPLVQNSGANFGVRTNEFGFSVSWAGGRVFVVEGCTNLTNPVWVPLATNTLTSASLYFSDPYWTNYHARFYRVLWP